MIAKSLYSGTVCLGCRLRLLRRSAQPLHLHVPNRISYNQSPSALQRISNESRARTLARELAAQEEEGWPDDKQEVKDGEDGEDGEEGQKPVPDEQLPGRRHRSRNRVLRESTERIGTDALGNPEYVIVMRDGGRYESKTESYNPEGNDDELQDRSHVTDIEALLDRMREPPSIQEVRDNIDGLRPETEITLSEREFRKLQGELANGFSIQQLNDYIHHCKITSDKPHKGITGPELFGEKIKAPDYSWILGVSPWVPLGSQSAIADGSDPFFDPSLHGYVNSSATGTEKLAVRIMRECWHLSITELSGGLGETRVKIRNEPFTLLMRGTQRFIGTLGQTLLGPGEKLEAFRNQHILRFITTKTKVAVLLQDLDKIMNSITAKTVPARLVTSEPIEDSILEELGRMTNTHIRKSDNRKRIQVTWIELKKRATEGLVGLEDLRHVVFRLLFTAFAPPRATMNLCTRGLRHDNPGRFITDTMSREKLGWKDRLGRWARYAFPITSDKRSLLPASPPVILEYPVEPPIPVEAEELDENKEFFPETQFPAHPVKWGSERRISTRACFGQVLHSQTPIAPPQPPHLQTANHPRVFAPVTPHPIHLAKLAADNNSDGSSNEIATSLTKSTIVIRFWPSPDLTAIDQEKQKTREAIKKAKKAIRKQKKAGKVKDEELPTVNSSPPPPDPILELRLATSDREVRGVESLRAITATSIADVMLPAAPVDMRFTQTEYVSLEGDRAKLEAWQPLADFLGGARLDLAKGKLEMPSRQRFPLPRRLFPANSSYLKRGRKPDATDPDAIPYVNPDPTPTPDANNPDANPDANNPDELVSISYEFVGLELHRSVSMPFEGHTLTYTSIEAGQGGGRRAEVTLEPAPLAADKETSGVEQDPKALQEDLVACCRRFATANDALWRTGA
ncbi:mitochondrial inner-membrane-bound regulator-domain-containing protein [Xylariaceae sp. FL0662B]|nr:mitochondrial inner-membrane-bound regulator-domain-containing protein [Xylariaceae sp. FL0662B]